MRLSRNRSFIIVVVVASLLVGGLIGFYFYTKNTNKPPTFLGQTTGGKSLGYNPSISTPVTSTSTSNQDRSLPLVVPKLRHITNQPVAGADFVLVDIVATSTKNVEPPDLSVTGTTVPKKTPPKVLLTEEKIRWAERGTGHIFETATTSLDIDRLSNTTLTKIYEAFFTSKGDSLILRDLVGSTDTIRTRLASLNFDTPTSTEQTTTTTDLPVNITQMARSPDRSQIFSIMNNGVRGIISNTDGSGKLGIFNSPFKEWLVQWPNKQGIILTTKPSGKTPGYAYQINPQTKSFSRVMGGINGLTTLVSPDLTKVLYSQSDGGSVKLLVYDRKTATSTDLFLRTISDKCVWSLVPVEKNLVYCGAPQDMAFNLYPDAWYQGNIVFSDSVWSINVETGEKRQVVYPPDEVGSIIDIQNPSISKAGDYMLFQNKIDLSLWGLRLKELPPVTFGSFGTSTSTATTTKPR